MSNLKHELEKIKIPKELHERAKLGVKKAKLESRKKKRIKNPLVAVAIAFILGVGVLLTPPIQAALEGIFEVSKSQESKKKDFISFGHRIEGTGVMEEVVYTSFEEMEEAFGMTILFPDKIWEIKPQSNEKQFRVGVDGDGNFISYDFNLATDEKIPQGFSVQAIKSSEAKVEFNAATLDGIAVEKEIILSDSKAKLFGVDELAYSIYLEKDDWKFVITMVEKNDELRTELTKDKEKQLIELAESIQ